MEAVEVKGIVLLLFAVAVLAFAAGTHLTRPVISSLSHAAAAARNAADDEGVDAYGNDVTSAVAEYSLDATGALYERHSPQTEIPHLGSPTS
jgi:hypothetical protein